MGIPEGEESQEGIGNLFEEIITENVPNQVKEKDTHVQEDQIQKSWTQRGLQKNTIKMARPKDKERIPKSAREKQVVIRLASDSSTETFQARKEWHEIFKVIKSKDLQPRLLYPAQLSLKLKEK